MPTLAERIRASTERSLTARDQYTTQTVSQLTQALKQAETEVKTSIGRYGVPASLPDNKLAALKGLEKLQAELGESLGRLKHEQTLVWRRGTKEGFRQGIGRGIGELTDAALPFYKDLTPGGIDKLATKCFTIVDTNALDFLAQYNLTLAGDIHRELADGIKRTLLTGIATGKGAGDIVRDLGSVIEDKDSFRQAGTRVFSKAQYRMEMIARTEVLRAHNMGRLKFHERAGVQQLEWLCMADERSCPVCNGLDGKVFLIDKFPQQPAHPHCRCTNIIAKPLLICGSDLSAKAAANDAQGDACILPPQVLEGMADAQAKENAALKKTFESGELGELEQLTSKQLQTLAKENGVSVARTKADFIKLLDEAEPGVDHGDLSGEALKAKLKQHKIGLLRTKSELAELLAQKQAALQQAKAVAKEQAGLPPLLDLENLTAAQLKEMAKEQGISLNMTKEDTIALLDKIEPGKDHSGLMGQELAAAKAKHGIGVLKNKQQLVEALQKKAGQQMAQQAQQQAQQAAAKKAKDLAQASVEKVVLPAEPTQFQGFLAQVKEAEQTLAGGGLVSTDELKPLAESLALKKKLFHDQIAGMKAGDLKKLAKDSKVKNWQWGSKDDFVALFTETDEAKVAEIHAKLEAGYKAHHEKYGKKKSKPSSSSSKPTPVPAPAQETSDKPAPFKKKGAEFDAVDDAWSKRKSAGAFKFQEKARVEGAHEKEFWIDDHGDRWLFKPVAERDEFIAHGEESAYRIGRLIDPEAVEVRTIRLNGRMGSIQRWRTDLQADFDFRHTLPENLTSDEVAQIQREHVLDWLVSNHDGHAKQFIRVKDGHVYGIDKGQAFKFLGKDNLSVDYHPNRACGEQEPYYNTVFRAAKDGKIRFDPAVTLQHIQEVEKVSDNDYLALLRPYAEGRFKGDQAGLKHFYDQALERKHNLRRDFEGYYGDILGDKKFSFQQLGAATGKNKRISAAQERILQEAEALGWQGKTLPIDFDDIEDQNALVFNETYQGKTRTVVKLKLRPEADARMLGGLRKGDMRGAPQRVGKALDEDVFYDDILAAVKTVNHHQQDGQYNMTSLEKAVKHKSALQDLIKHGDAEIRDMAQGYLSWIEKAEKAHSERQGIEGTLNQYLRKQEPPRRKSEAAFTVERGGVESTLRAIDKGVITVQDDAASNTVMFRGHHMKKGEQYTATFPDGTRVRYRPWNDANHYAQRGEMEVTLPRKASPDDVADTLTQLEGLGINIAEALPEHTEWMYLRKMAYVAKADDSDAYKQVLKGLEDRDATVTERVQTLRGYWQQQLGVRDLTTMPGYNPHGEYQMGFLDRKLEGGYRHQYRFDLSDKDLEKEMKGHALFHNLTDGARMDTFIETVLENNGAMVSTVEKMRIGIPPGGMSPAADMDTGGASYFFTRIKKLPARGKPTSKGLYFKKRMLRRMDAVSYDHDAFGRVTDDYVRSRRGNTPEEWRRFAGSTGNETIFKYSVTLLDNVEYIVTDNATERNRVLNSFVKRGLTVLPDGRKIEEIIL